jgi:hypothetical protein
MAASCFVAASCFMAASCFVAASCCPGLSRAASKITDAFAVARSTPLCLA